jgi:hypothetical protein
MKAFILACVAAAVIAVIGFAVLDVYQEPVTEAYSTNAVRLGA